MLFEDSFVVNVWYHIPWPLGKLSPVLTPMWLDYETGLNCESLHSAI